VAPLTHRNIKSHQGRSEDAVNQDMWRKQKGEGSGERRVLGWTDQKPQHATSGEETAAFAAVMAAKNLPTSEEEHTKRATGFAPLSAE